MDPDSIRRENIFISASSQEHLSGPYTQILNSQPGLYDQLLEEPGFEGIVLAANRLEYISTEGSALGTDFVDTEGTALYNSRVYIKPERHLRPQTQYTLHIAGKQYTSIDAGVAERSVFDPSPDVGNGGTGRVLSGGQYQGTTTEAFLVQIVDGGFPGDATYFWQKIGAPPSSVRKTHAKRFTLSEGVKVSFDPRTEFVAGDTYTIGVRPVTYLDGLAQVSFVTGNYGASIDLAQHSATHISQVAPPIPTVGGPQAANFYVKYTLAKSFSQISGTEDSIEVHFNKPLDTGSLDTNGLEIKWGHVNGVVCTGLSEETYSPNNVDIDGTKMTIYFENT